MVIMQTRNMETATNNAKVMDSGYNTCSNSQSHTSSESSISRNSNRSASSGYHGENLSTFGSRTETLPKPITKCKAKGCKKKSESLHTNELQTQKQQQSTIEAVVAGTFAAPLVKYLHASLPVDQPCKPILDKATEKVAVVELVDATNPRVHNDNNLATATEAGGLATKPCPIDEPSSQSTEKYYAVISLHDGLVLQATQSLHASLGYPNDWWTGKLFTNFLDPRDKHILSEKIASEIALFKDFCSLGAKGQKASIFCRLRRFNFFQYVSVNNHQYPQQQQQQQQEQDSANIQYVPYRINMIIQNFHADKTSTSQNPVMLLVASFHPLRSAYKEPEETIIPTVFTTRHTSTCYLSYVDHDVVQYLGYLPQDMIGHSLFDFYYPEDLPLIKDIYETLINNESSSFRSKPYRYIIQNGTYVVLETEWSSFTNPWTKNLEFIVGRHRVLKGPSDPNIFRPPGDQKTGSLANISEKVLKEAKIIKNEILALLEAVQKKPRTPAINCDLLTKKQELATFAESILQEIKSPVPIKALAMDDRSFSEHDSVMLGEISPHHEDFDSKSSIETPPSYNQLNYHDNIERFFNSNIGVTANNAGLYGSNEENLHSSANSSDEPGKNNASRPDLKCQLSTNGSGNSGSAENLSSESNNQQSFDSSREATSNTTSNTSTNNGRPMPPLLTESLLNRHNKDMEKLMMQKHREQKKSYKRNKSSDQKMKNEQNARRDPANNKNGLRLKRSGSLSWEGNNNFKISKYDDSAKVTQNVRQIPATANPKFTPTNVDASANMAKANPNINLWPKIPMTRPTATKITQQCFTTSNACSQAITRFPTFPPMFPAYYHNPSPTAVLQEYPGPPNQMTQRTPYCFVPVPYMTTAMPSLMYQPFIGAPTPASMMYRSFIVPENVPTTMPTSVPTTISTTMPTTTCSTATTTQMTATNSSFDLTHPASCATSVRSEPGSTAIMSESSKQMYYNKNKKCHADKARKRVGMLCEGPPWNESLKLTPELMYQYQIEFKPLPDVLQEDLEFLRHSKQPNLVNDQLEQLFLDLDLKGFGSKLILGEASLSSQSDSSSETPESPSRMGAW